MIYPGRSYMTSGSTSNPTISINPSSGTVATFVTVTDNGFDPISSVTITFGGSNVTTVTPAPVEDSLLPLMYLIPHRLEIRSLKPYKDLIPPRNFLQLRLWCLSFYLIRPLGQSVRSVDIVGAISNVTITFNGAPITTNPAIVTTTPNGVFSADFTVLHHSLDLFLL